MTVATCLQDAGEFTLELENPTRYVPWCSVDPYPSPEEKHKEVDKFPLYFNEPKPFEVTVKAGEMLYLWAFLIPPLVYSFLSFSLHGNDIAELGLHFENKTSLLHTNNILLFLSLFIFFFFVKFFFTYLLFFLMFCYLDVYLHAVVTKPNTWITGVVLDIVYKMVWDIFSN